MENLDLSDFFKTRAESHDFSARIGVVAGRIFHTDFDLEKALMEQFGMKKKDKFLAIMRDNKITDTSRDSLQTFLTKLQEAVATLPVLSIALAFEPGEQTLKALSEWCIMNIKRQILFDIQVDEKLIAGATIAFKGKYLDYSLKAKFEKILQAEMTGAQIAASQQNHSPLPIAIPQHPPQIPPPSPSSVVHQPAQHITPGN